MFHFSVTGDGGLVPQRYPHSPSPLPRLYSLSFFLLLPCLSCATFSLFLPISPKAAPFVIRATSSCRRARLGALRSKHVEGAGKFYLWWNATIYGGGGAWRIAVEKVLKRWSTTIFYGDSWCRRVQHSFLFKMVLSVHDESARIVGMHFCAQKNANFASGFELN